MNLLDISSATTANRFLDDFIKIGILEQKDLENKRNKEYIFEDYLSLFR